MSSQLELRYLEGVALWRERDLEEAVAVLELVVEDGDAADGNGWWHPASRALAQIALEADQMRTAERHLLRLQGTGVGDAQTLSLRARRWFQLGDEDAAMAEVDMAALERLQTEHRPYALVIRVPARNEEALHALVARISQLFQDQPSLGFVDGTGTDGTVWEIFLDGDDPDRLWASVRPLLAPPDQWRDAEVTMRSGSDTVRFRLDS